MDVDCGVIERRAKSNAVFQLYYLLTFESCTMTTITTIKLEMNEKRV